MGGDFRRVSLSLLNMAGTGSRLIAGSTATRDKETAQMALQDVGTTMGAGHGAGDPLPAMGEPIANGLYRHYKGGRYEVLGLVRHSETLEVMVLYRALYGEHGLWVRPRAMFEGQLLVDGAIVTRFTPLADAAALSHTGPETD
jgi:hypothetical protein